MSAAETVDNPLNFQKGSSDQLEIVTLSPSSIKVNLSFNYTGSVSLLITFKLQNQTEISNYLSGLNNRSSPSYHKYITREEFASRYSVSPLYYEGVVNYFESYPGVRIQTYSDRISMGIKASSTTVDEIFHTFIKTQNQGGTIYYASTEPSLPKYIADEVSAVSGFSNVPLASSSYYRSHMRGFDSPADNLFSTSLGVNASSSKSYLTNGPNYPQPFLYNGTQMIFGSDLQIAYQETTLLNITYPTNEIVATILWSGYNSSGQSVGPYYPQDIYSYFNDTLPSYEPRPHVAAAPINGAPQPGISSTYDTSGASRENTLDLEMIGSTAPGASIYNVYGPSSSSVNLDEALAFILNLNSSYSNLNNVSVISNSWGTQDYNDSAWYSYLQEAQARGITVLASSGDSGDNVNSSKYLGTNYAGDYTEFPSSMAYDAFGVTAVGGTTLTLNSTLQIENQIAWNISSVSEGGPVGSTGGVSKVFPEPSWQIGSEANTVIQGQGRGVPDISAIANNTITYNTVNGTSYYYFETGYFYYNWGTSVASPVVAGIVLEIDAILSHYGGSNLGYLNPTLYELGNLQVQPLTNSSAKAFDKTGTYNSTLPMLPFYDVISGKNNVILLYLFNFPLMMAVVALFPL